MENWRLIEDLKTENKYLKERIAYLEAKLSLYELKKTIRERSIDFAAFSAYSKNLKHSIATRTPLSLKGYINLALYQLYPDLKETEKVWQKKQVIADIFMTLTSGSMRIQQVLLGLVLYSCNAPDLIWRVLSRLGLAPSEKFLIQLLTTTVNEGAEMQETTVYGMDTTYISTNHTMKSTTVHPITICLANRTSIVWNLHDQVYRDVRIEDLRTEVLQIFSSPSTYTQWFLITVEKLKSGSKISYPTSTLIGSAPFVYPNTQSYQYGIDSKKASPYGNVDDLILDLCKKNKTRQNPFPTFIYADWEYYSKILSLSQSETMLVPVIATWHYCWHFVKAIFILFGDWLLLPIAERLRWRKIKKDAQDYHACCDFLVALTEAAIGLIQCFRNQTDVLEHYRQMQFNAKMYSELIYFVVHAGVPLCTLLVAIRQGNFETFQNCVRQNLPIFLAAQKKHYSLLTVHFIWLTNRFSTKAIQIYCSNLWFKLTAHSAWYSANDVVIENVNHFNTIVS